MFVSLAIAADANGWSSFSVGVGPFVLLEFQRTVDATTTTFGAGMAAAALLAGVLNAAGAAVLARRD